MLDLNNVKKEISNVDLDELKGKVKKLVDDKATNRNLLIALIIGIAILKIIIFLMIIKMNKINRKVDELDYFLDIDELELDEEFLDELY